jgi:ABC-type Fe3+-hydroxamate transport system substrate-binding protein
MGKNRDKFIELAEKRVTRAIKDLRLVGNLANKTNYAYTDEDAKKILATLDSEVKNIRKKFENTRPDEEIVFKL